MNSKKKIELILPVMVYPFSPQFPVMPFQLYQSPIKEGSRSKENKTSQTRIKTERIPKNNNKNKNKIKIINK